MLQKSLTSSEDYNEIKLEILKILKEYKITSSEQWYTTDEETGSVLYERLKARVVEVFGLEDEEMEWILEEILEELHG